MISLAPDKPSISAARQDMEDKLAALYADYAAHLPRRIAEMETAWEYICRQWNPDALKLLHVAAHKLGGSGGSLGFVEVSQVGRTLEGLLAGVVESGHATDQDRVEIRAALDDLKKAAGLPQAK